MPPSAVRAMLSTVGLSRARHSCLVGNGGSLFTPDVARYGCSKPTEPPIDSSYGSSMVPGTPLIDQEVLPSVNTIAL